jgi:hypothetical protein
VEPNQLGTGGGILVLLYLLTYPTKAVEPAEATAD